MNNTIRLKQYAAPLNNRLAKSLTDFWEDIFACSFDFIRTVTAGHETAINNDLFWVSSSNTEIVGTSHLTQPTLLPHLGGMGEIAVKSFARKQGLGERHCHQAIDYFEKNSGQYLFLGTNNPGAQKLYSKLGWRELENSDVMVRSEYALEDLYKNIPGKFQIKPGSALERISMIPLILSTKVFCCLDANTNIYSTSCQRQKSCMGLFPKYQNLKNKDNAGGWLAMYRSNVLTGLMSWKTVLHNIAVVDGFVHDTQTNLFSSFLKQGVQKLNSETGITIFKSRIMPNDKLKLAAFKEAGFSLFRKTDEIISMTFQL
jgi:predicted GNAT family N-acyltransferase